MDSIMKGQMGQCPSPRIFGLEPPLKSIVTAVVPNVVRKAIIGPGQLILMSCVQHCYSLACTTAR